MALKDLVVTGQEAAFLRAVKQLREAGWVVAPSEIPGLTYVGGHEMTIGQVIDLASKQRR